MSYGKLLFIFFGLLLFSITAFGQEGQSVKLTAESFKNGQPETLNKPVWKYHTGDDLTWAAPEMDDAAWQILDPSQMYGGSLKPDWNGKAWFRLRLDVDESLVGQPVSLMLWQYGASEIYLNGALVQKFGELGENFDKDFNPQGVPVPLVFSKAGAQTLAVRFSFLTARDLTGGTGEWLSRGHFSPGFSAYLQPGFAAVNAYTARQVELNEYKFFSGILFAFAFLHFFLFIFYRRERANLDYSIFAFLLATGNALSSLSNNSRQPAVIAALTFVFFVIFYSSSFIALLSFLYVAFAEKFSKFFWAMGVYLAILIGVMLIYSRSNFTLYVVVGFILLTMADALRIMISALRRRKGGAWIIMAGVGVFSLGVAMLLLRELEFAVWTGFLELFRNIALYLAIPVAVSVYLARNFARVSQNLETKLAEVEVFSERAIEHEKEKARMQMVEAESERRAAELEEARQLQLSMLPKKLPQIPNLEIAAYMKPASEVGGDYYDFHVSKDEMLTIVIGDATGHGLKAGTVVTATKSLFNAFAGEEDIPQIFSRINRALKAMNLRGLFMAMTMLKFKDNNLIISAAGMPSALVYRAALGEVEELDIRALPLGNMTNIAYRQQEIALAKGDCVVVMTDGFPEMFNPADEMLGFDKAAGILREMADAPPQEIIDRFVETSRQWAEHRPADDDVTFVVFKLT